MNLAHLRLFVRIASTHNISQAGSELGLSPAVASSHINKLEERLGVRLVHRTTRKVSLTEDGEIFLPHAEDVLARVEAATASVSPREIALVGTLRITAPASFGRMHIIPLMKHFCSENPGLNVDLRLTDSVVDLVDGGFDLAIRNSKLDDSSFIARKLAPDNRIVCASPGYIEAHGIPESPKELERHQCINLGGLDTWVFEGQAGPVSVKTRGCLKVDNGEAVRDACIEGMGVALTSTWCSFRALQNGSLVRILEDHPIATDSSIWAVYPSSHLLAPRVRVFIDYLLQQLGTPPSWDRPLMPF